jgi:DNA polymerase-3 subunit gamma/tau
MFEQLGESQKEIADMLSSQIGEGTFGRVNLFGGPRYSLRMTAAIEVARVLSCLGDRSAGCRCESCRRFDLLTASNLVIVSQRDHKRVIETAIDSFVRLRTDFSRRFLIRNVRIFLLQFHGSLASGSQTQAQGASYDQASAVDDLLLDLAAKGAEISEREAASIAKSLRSALKPLFGSAKRNTTITVNQVRALEEWITRTSAREEKRFVVIESLEQANASARNSLLKLFEEPPEGVWFTLVSEYPGRIMQTILSRVRRYSFPALGTAAVQSLLEPFFLGDHCYRNLEQFFLAGGGLDLEQTKQQVSLLVDAAVSHAYLPHETLCTLLSQVDKSDGHEYFLKEVLASIERKFIEGSVPYTKAKALEALVSSAFSDARQFNQNKKLMLEALYYSMMETQ